MLLLTLKFSCIQGSILISLTLCQAFCRLLGQGSGVKIASEEPGELARMCAYIRNPTANNGHHNLSVNKVTHFHCSLPCLTYPKLRLHFHQAAFLMLSYICSTLHHL